MKTAVVCLIVVIVACAIIQESTSTEVKRKLEGNWSIKYDKDEPNGKKDFEKPDQSPLEKLKEKIKKEAFEEKLKELKEKFEKEEFKEKSNPTFCKSDDKFEKSEQGPKNESKNLNKSQSDESVSDESKELKFGKSEPVKKKDKKQQN